MDELDVDGVVMAFQNGCPDKALMKKGDAIQPVLELMLSAVRLIRHYTLCYSTDQRVLY